MFKHLILVGIGGGAGSMLRYLVSLWIYKISPNTVFPWATLFVNISGCLLMGLFLGLASKYSFLNQELRYLLVAGFCGGYTTFSAFSAENFNLLEKEQYMTLATYTLASVMIGVLFFYIGYQLSKN